MNKYLNIFVTLLVMSLCSCADEADTDNLRLSNGYMSVGETNVALSGQGEAKSISVTANCAWRATCSSDWITLNPASGNSNAVMTVSAQANPSVTSDRSATITVSTDDGLTRTIHLRQEKNNETLTLNTDSIAFTAAGDTKAFVIESNAQWSILGQEEWLALSKTSGEGNDQISVSVVPNVSEDDRKAILTVKGVAKSERIIIYQEGAAKSLTINTMSLGFEAIGNTKVIEISGDASWTATASEEWVTLDQLQGTGTYALQVTCSDNATMASRTAQVTIRTRREVLVCTITQAAGLLPLVSGIQTVSVGRYAVSVTARFASDFPVTEYGFCYSETNQTPMTSDKTVKVVTQTDGAFATEINGLDSHKTYYIRAYAVNKVGVGYSSVMEVTTEGGIPNQGDNQKPNI